MQFPAFLRYWLPRAATVLLLCGVTAAVMLYAGSANVPPTQGSTDDPALSDQPGADSTLDLENPADSGTADSERVDISTEIPSESTASNPVTRPTAAKPQNALTREEILEICENRRLRIYNVPTLLSEGFSRTTGDYESGKTVLAYAGGFDFTPSSLSLYRGTKTVVEYVRPTEKSAPVAVYSEESVRVPSVQLYMGYMLIDDGKTTKLYSSDGFYLLTYTTGKTIPAYTRDTAGRPLFYQEAADGSRLYFSAGEGKLIPSDYNDATDGRGLYFDYSPTFGISDSSLLRLARPIETVTTDEDGTETTENSTLWAFGYSAAWLRTAFSFTSAFDFSEKLAAVTDEEGKLYYINESGYRAFTTQKTYYYFQRYVIEYLLPPLTNGPESIGFYYYDHGLVRARRQIIDYGGYTYYDEIRVAADEDILIDQNGQEFPIPEGYTIEAYSCGVILLSKDGRYGYMNADGAWIAQPIYEYAEPFSEGLAVCGFGTGTRLMIDTDGNIVIPTGAYSYISSASSGVIAAWSRKDGWVILHKMAKFE